MKQLRFLLVQPATDRYAWEVEVTLKNSLKLGYNGNFIDVIGAFDDEPAESWLKLQREFPHVRFFFYKSNMGACNYPPAIQAHTLKKHFQVFPELKNDAIFFHDCDFVFTKYLDFSKFLNDDKWYFSDTISYVGSKYIESKGEELLEGMCSVVGLCACTVRANQASSGGAQKLMKNLTPEYWQEVETDAIMLYNWLLQKKDDYGDKEINDIQIWTASMWSELWNAWKHGHEVVVPEEFNFLFATDPIEKWDKSYFFHNAGVVDNESDMFFKGDYFNKYPYNTKLNIDSKRCSKKYYDLIQEVGKESVLIS